VKTATCEHLDAYLAWGTTRAFFEPQVRIEQREDIDEFPEARAFCSNTRGVWELFKKLRKLPLANDQILILIRTFGLGQSRRLIMREMGEPSSQTYQRRLAKAVQILRGES
jgi:hypothetical protein